MSEQLNLTQSELATAQSTFTAHYAPVYTDLSFDWNIRVKWPELFDAVESNITWPADQTLLRFIHRYDEDGWFLTMQICHVTENGTIEDSDFRFDLRNSGIRPNNTFTALYDQAYFDNVQYDGNLLLRGANVNYVILPWSQELKEGAIVNGIVSTDDVNIVFSSISFDFGTDTSRVKVQYPHTLAFYFSGEEGDFLDNIAYTGTSPLVRNKAYDYADPCPANCSVNYTWHSFFSNSLPY